MQRLILISIYLLTSLTIFAQSNVEAGTWFKYTDEQTNASLFDHYYKLASDTMLFPNLITNNITSPTTVYWDGNSWQTTSPASSQQLFLLLPAANNSARIALSVEASNGEYDLFTKDGWVHINSGLNYNYAEDYLHYDEPNNRLIMFKQNIPWLFYLNDEE